MKTMLTVMVLVGLLVAGCSGVYMNAKYSGDLDQSCGWAQNAVERSDANGFTIDEYKKVLAMDANFLREFKNARDGKGE
jgi:hypothetical protein